MSRCKQIAMGLLLVLTVAGGVSVLLGCAGAGPMMRGADAPAQPATPQGGMGTESGGSTSGVK